mgnify:CR=1 FL=1
MSTTLTGFGIEVDVPRGWDVEIYQREDEAPDEGTLNAMVHAANFALPPDRGDYGSGAYEQMDAGGVMVVLFEFDRASASTNLFASSPRPTSVSADDFDPACLQRPMPGRSGMQIFFRDEGRAFCLYVMLGSHRRRRALVGEVNDFLGRLHIAP